MARNYFKKGSFNRIDDRSGFKKKADQTKQEWTGMIVATESWEPRNAQDFVVGIPDRMDVENARPEGADNFSLAPAGPVTSWLIYMQSQSNTGPITANGGMIVFFPASNPTDPSSG